MSNISLTGAGGPDVKSALREFARRFLPPKTADGRIAVPVQSGSADAFMGWVLANCGVSPRQVLLITPGLPEADRLADDLRVLTAQDQTRILEFPPPLDGDKSALGTRIKTMAALRAWGLSPYPCVVVVPYSALSVPIPRGVAPTLVLAVGTDSGGNGAESQKFSDICSKLAKFGYNRVNQVEQEGDYSVRGGIVDIWSPGEEFPVRAEFFGDDLEGLRHFDASTQISIGRTERAEILPVKVAGTDPEAAGTDQIMSEKVTLPDLFSPGSSILAIDHNSYSIDPFVAVSRKDRTVSRWSTVMYVGDPAPAGVAGYSFQTVSLPGFAELGADEAHHPELFEAARHRLDRHLAAARSRGDAVCSIDGLSGGFEIDGLAVVTKADRVFVKRHVRSHHTGVSSCQGARLSDFEELEPGEYVVHVDYGVGRFVGSSEIVVDGKRSEVFTIEYADGGKLHVPAAHAHLLSRYVGVKGESVRLHRLDGVRWEKDKKDAQRAVSDLASALLETQARREVAPGFAYAVDCDGIAAFEAAFPYEETADQLAAIAAVKKDMGARKPMDRLICGDAGYGKTEVAMRAAYIAAMNGKQVAVLAPTTVLAEQHFETFTSRFDGTPVRIESVSRFQSAGTHAGTFRRIAAGICDIVIGTHAILSHKIAFHDLGLIIIDEEQRFGVRHKEFLKRLRETADVLTLSATPIPRTLYLSMTGARDLSLLRTPPRARVAVETKIVTDSDEIVRAAVASELARGGQVFFLHNRVMSISRVERRLKSILPEARIVVAHGQMDAETLARKMRSFEHGEADVLLSTTIVESGIDIPRANTIVVDHAETFGLADLYQLRGRVGRSTVQGRAIFLLPSGGLVDSDARERLSALKRHGGLGGGFNLAVRDLELRGAGNLLGAQQSGHIAAVGFSLYCQLLRRTVSMLKGEKVRDIVDVKLNLDFIDLSPASGDMSSAAALPYDYVEEDAQRMGFMKRFAEAVDRREVKAVADELADRFGPLPSPARRLVKLSNLRVVCAAAGVGFVDVKDGRAVLRHVGTRAIERSVQLVATTPDRRIDELMRLISSE